MERYVCWIDEKGFVIYRYEQELIVYTMYFNEAHDAVESDWQNLILQKSLTNYTLLKAK